jgi:thioredoxin 1
MAEGVLDLTEADFDSMISDSKVPVLVDFWAEWCGPCKMLTPILEELAVEYGEKLKIAKVNVDDNPTLAQRYKVRSIPNLVLIKDGEQIGQVVGALPKGELKSRVDSFIT